MACNDDACGPSQSRLSFAALQGQTYLLRIGTYGGTAGGVGTFVVQPPNIVQNPANGHFYSLTPGYTGPVFPRVLNLGVGSIKDSAATWRPFPAKPKRIGCAPPSPRIGFWFGRVQDIQDPGYSEPGGGWTWMTGEPVTYTQWNPGQPDNFGQPNWVAEFGELHADGGWDDVWVNDTNNNGYLTEWSAGRGQDFLRSHGSQLDWNVDDLARGDGCHYPQGVPIADVPRLARAVRLLPRWDSLHRSGGDDGGKGVCAWPLVGGAFWVATTSQGTQLNSLGRFDAAGQFQNLSGTSASGPGFDIPLRLPLSGLPTIQPGQEWFFQAWHREVDGQSNFSNGLGLVF